MKEWNETEDGTTGGFYVLFLNLNNAMSLFYYTFLYKFIV